MLTRIGELYAAEAAAQETAAGDAAVLLAERRARVAALCYTLLESAKLAGVEPAAYLAEATRRAIARPGTVTFPRDLRAA